MRYLITLAGRTYPPTRLIESDWVQYGASRAYFCPQCGEIWARWTLEAVDGPDIRPAAWQTTLRTCPNHQLGAWTDDRPGCLLTHVADAVVLPRELLIRELFLNVVPSGDDPNEQSPS